MKITLFIGGLSGGGAERVICNLSNYLSKRHDVTILTMSNDKPAYDLSDKVRRISLVQFGESDNKIIKNLKRIKRFREYVKRNSPDIYITMLPNTINFMLFNRKIINAPILISERGDPKTRYESSRLKKFIMKKLYPKADGVVFQTEEAKSYYTKFIGDKGIIIPNAINSEFIRKPYSGQRKKRIVSAGRFSEQKNFSMLIEAFSKIIVDYPDFELVIYGDGALRNDLEKQIKKNALENKVLIPGYVEGFGDHIFDAALFVLPSNYEGMPNALMEAMALGLPCISTDCPVGGPRYLINNNMNGLLISPGNLNELIEAIEKLLSDDFLRHKIGNNAKEIVSTLNPEVIYYKWETYISSLQN